jgi:hypothetical protein
MDSIDTGAKGFRRVEVLTGPARRRRWSAAEKARIVAETLVPGASVNAYDCGAGIRPVGVLLSQDQP